MKKINRDYIKIIALLFMFGNHYANIFLEKGSLPYCILVYLGYFTAPAMCCFLVEGFYYTRSRKNYAIRLAVFALISQAPFYLAFSDLKESSPFHLNMIYSLLVCFLLLWALESPLEYGKKQAAVLILFAAGSFGDWSVLAQVFTLLFWQLRRQEQTAGTKEYRQYALIVWAAIAGMTFLNEFLGTYSQTRSALPLLMTVGSMTGPLLAGFFILYLYNGKQASHGRLFFKWFCYLFYPGHLLVLWLIRINLI